MNKLILKIEKWKVNYEYTPRGRTISLSTEIYDTTIT